MGGYVVRRLLAIIPALLAILTLTFIMINLAPGDPARAYVEEGGGPGALEAARQRMGLDAPLHVRYVRYLALVMQGSLGNSLVSGRPVTSMIASQYPYSIQLGAASLVIAMALALPLGFLAAIRRNSVLDRLVTTGSVLGYSIPNFWLALALILVFSVHLRWFPVIGAGATGDLFSTLRHLALPAVVMGLSEAAFLTRMTRSAIIEELQKDYVRTARSKGASEARVLARHILRNGIIPVLTVVGFGLASVISGSVVIETMFVRPGVGYLLLNAINQRDYPLVQGTLLTFAAAVLTVNLLIDIMYGFLDPRIRYE